jgi:8-oxo-dGTP pyrophosphatase MutT (NUDIX family)
MRPSKACPVVLRDAATTEILVCEHPLAGIQLVKGSIEANETPAAAAQRELLEEAGLVGHIIADLGEWDARALGQVWSFQRCCVDRPARDEWVHRTADDGGHDFRLFWHPLDIDPGPSAHVVYRDALVEIRRRVVAAQAMTAS